LSEPIYEPGELLEAEQPPWWRALVSSVRHSEAWPYIQRSLAGQVVLRFFNDWGNRDASQIAWSGLVSVLPLLLAAPVVSVVVLRLVGVDVNHGEEQVLTSLIPDGPLRSSVDQALRAVSGHAVLVSVVAVLGLVWRGSAVFRQLEMCLSRIAGVRPRRFVHRLLLAMVLIGLIGLVSLATTGATAFFFANPKLEGVAHPVEASLAAFGGQVLIGLVVGFGVFMFIYGVIPNHAYRVRQVWPGAAFATVCFELLSLLFPLWAVVNRNFGSYGTDLALSIVLVVYFYLFGVIVVLGADINAVLWKRTSHPYPGEPKRA
jgi:membrane protein